MIPVPVNRSAYFELSLVCGKHSLQYPVEFKPDLVLWQVDATGDLHCGATESDSVRVTYTPDFLAGNLNVDAMIRSDSAKISIFACAC